MRKIRIIKAEQISVGKRLKELIESTGKSYNEFLDDLSIWKDEHPQYEKIRLPLPTHLSRWINEGAQMRPDKIQMFADYFKVDFEYLNCTQIEPNKSKRIEDGFQHANEFDYRIDVETLAKEIREFENDLKLIEFLKSMNYKIEFSSATYEQETQIDQVLDNKTIYTAEYVYTMPTEQTITLTYPDGEEREISESKLYSLLCAIRKYIDFSMESLRKEVI